MVTLQSLVMLLVVGADTSDWVEDKYNFRNKEFDFERLMTIGDLKLIQRHESGLTVAIGSGDVSHNTGFGSSRQIVGDCEITVDFELLKLPQPRSGDGTGTTLQVEGAGYGARSQRVMMPDGNHAFVTDVYRLDGPREHGLSREVFSAVANSGSMRFSRDGSILKYLVREADSETFQELRSVTFTDQPIRFVRVYAQPSGSNTVSARWPGLRVRAEGFLEAGQRLPAQSSGVVKVLIGIVLSAALVGAWLWRKPASRVLKPAA